MTTFFKLDRRDGNHYWAQIDDEDIHLIPGFRWQADVRSNGVYVKAHIPQDRRMVYLHHRITGFAFVDHVNGNPLDNRRANLRESSYAQNNCNTRPRTGGTSRYKGVCWFKRGGKWQTRVAGEHIAYFDDELMAARAYDIVASQRFGEHARLNFPTAHEGAQL